MFQKDMLYRKVVELENSLNDKISELKLLTHYINVGTSNLEICLKKDVFNVKKILLERFRDDKSTDVDYFMDSLVEVGVKDKAEDCSIIEQWSAESGIENKKYSRDISQFKQMILSCLDNPHDIVKNKKVVNNECDETEVPLEGNTFLNRSDLDMNFEIKPSISNIGSNFFNDNSKSQISNSFDTIGHQLEASAFPTHPSIQKGTINVNSNIPIVENTVLRKKKSTNIPFDWTETPNFNKEAILAMYKNTAGIVMENGNGDKRTFKGTKNSDLKTRGRRVTRDILYRCSFTEFESCTRGFTSYKYYLDHLLNVHHTTVEEANTLIGPRIREEKEETCKICGKNGVRIRAKKHLSTRMHIDALRSTAILQKSS